MKSILFICDADPFNANMGNAQRTSIFLKAFLSNGFHIDIAVIGNLDVAAPQCLPDNVSIVLWNQGHQWKTNNIPKFLKRILINSNATSFELKEKIRSILNKKNYDYVFCRYIKNALLSCIFQMNQNIILDIDDLPEKSYYTNFQRPDSLLRRLYRNYVVCILKKQTRYCIRKSYVSFLPNKKEAIEYGTVYLPNISTINKINNELYIQNHSVLFIGSLTWAPNHNGIDHFIDCFWNDIIRQVPDAKLIIAGKGLPDKFIKRWSSYNNVQYLGFVEDIYGFYALGNIVICPIYAGAGTNIKVIEAMSMGKACVLSTSSARGYEDILKHSYNVLIDQDNASFSKHVVSLLTNDSLRNEIAENAHKTANTYFSQAYVDKVIADCCN